MEDIFSHGGKLRTEVNLLHSLGSAHGICVG
jgi:hypothetical protein